MIPPEPEHNTRRRQSFPKKERLSSKIKLEELFKKGSSDFLYPFKIYFLPAGNPQPQYPAVVISVPKRIFKKAVDRNRIKRLVREAYRKNKYKVFEEKKIPAPEALGIIYVAREKKTYSFIENKLISLLYRLENTLSGSRKPEKF